MANRARSETEETVLFVRGIPRDLLARMKAAAALHHQTLGGYVRSIFEDHLEELERKGQLPKSRG